MDRRVGVVDADAEGDPTPFRSHWFESSVGLIHYIDERPADPGARTVLLLHGNPGWRSSGVDVVRRLSGRFRCVAVDYPGFGPSVHPTGFGFTASEHAVVVRELVVALGIWDVVVVGRDWGGLIGLEVASHIPDRVSGMVMGDTWYWAQEGCTLNAVGITSDTPPMRWFDRHRDELLTLRRGASPFHTALDERIRRHLTTTRLLLLDDLPRWHEDFHNAHAIPAGSLVEEISGAF